MREADAGIMHGIDVEWQVHRAGKLDCAGRQEGSVNAQVSQSGSCVVHSECAKVLGCEGRVGVLTQEPAGKGVQELQVSLPEVLREPGDPPAALVDALPQLSGLLAPVQEEWLRGAARSLD